jgi:anti-anti-sigma regulatory factor
MFRIRVDDASKTTTLYIEGKLLGDSVHELRRVWTTIRSESPEKPIVIELSSVLIVDIIGRKLLGQMHEWGTQLAGSGLVIGPLIEEITGATFYKDS